MTGTLVFTLQVPGPFKFESEPYTIALGPATIRKADRKLLAWWKFDENSGNTAADLSGNGYTGTLVGNPRWQPSGGRFGGALEFDGNSHVEVPTLDLTTDTVTFVAWINGWKVADMTGIVLSRNLPGGLIAGGIHFGQNDTLHYTWNNNSTKTYIWDDGPKIPRDEWAMLAMTIEPAKATAYVCTQANGLQKSVNKIDHVPQNMNALKIGWDSWSAERHFKGLIDDVRIYNYPLSQAEVAALYAGKELRKGRNWMPVVVIVVIAVVVVGLATRRKKTTT